MVTQSHLNRRVQLAPELDICRLLIGMWQVSGEHGEIDRVRAVEAMIAHHRAGFTTFDLADHYGPAEDFVGDFVRHPIGFGRGFQAFTKWVPEPRPFDRATVEAAVDRARERMACDSLDMLQFHWWDYQDPRPLDALRHLMDLRQDGKLRHLGLTNVDSEHLRRIHDAGMEVVSNQVQYSVLDMRPSFRMTEVCQGLGVKLLAYGTLCGGFLAERYRGQTEPDLETLESASLRKYKKMIDAWGGWALFQELLDVLAAIGRRHCTSLSNIAVAYVLERPAVAGVILGCRLGVTEHLTDNAEIFSVQLDDEDRLRIAAIQSRSRDLLSIIGDCGDEYRQGQWRGSR